MCLCNLVQCTPFVYSTSTLRGVASATTRDFLTKVRKQTKKYMKMYVCMKMSRRENPKASMTVACSAQTEETTDYAEATSNPEPDVTTAPGKDPAPSLGLP